LRGAHAQILYLLTEAIFLLDIVNFLFPIKEFAFLVTAES